MFVRNGMLLVETQNYKQAEVPLKANLLGTYPVLFEEHVLFISSSVNTSSLDGMFDNKIQNELENHFHSELYS
jgi:hypothetical protein